jgi:hypothetical protein
MDQKLYYQFKIIDLLIPFSGKQFDKKGNLIQWWDVKSLEEYNKRVECLIHQYDKFHIPKIGQYVSKFLCHALWLNIQTIPVC